MGYRHDSLYRFVIRSGTRTYELDVTVPWPDTTSPAIENFKDFIRKGGDGCTAGLFTCDPAEEQGLIFGLPTWKPVCVCYGDDE